MSKMIWKFQLTVGEPHDVPIGRVVLVSPVPDRPSLINVWVEWDRATGLTGAQALRVFGTGHDIPQEAEHVGSCVSGAFVWHVYSVAPPRN